MEEKVISKLTSSQNRKFTGLKHSLPFCTSQKYVHYTEFIYSQLFNIMFSTSEVV